MSNRTNGSQLQYAASVSHNEVTVGHIKSGQPKIRKTPQGRKSAVRRCY